MIYNLFIVDKKLIFLYVLNMQEKFGREDLIEKLRLASDLTVHDAAYLSGFLIDSLSNALAEGKTIELRGFGTFEIRTAKARKRVNPRTREIVNVPEHKTIHFKPCLKLKTSVWNEKPIVRPLRKNSIDKISEPFKILMAKEYDFEIPDTYSEFTKMLNNPKLRKKVKNPSDDLLDDFDGRVDPLAGDFDSENDPLADFDNTDDPLDDLLK
jgi:nucleoid DNA-binding protein